MTSHGNSSSRISSSLGLFPTSLPLVQLILGFLFIIQSFNTNSCVYARKRLVVEHHKTGTMLARRLATILSGDKADIPKFALSKVYTVETSGQGIDEDLGVADDYTNVLHMVRNPFSMILSSYYYHIETTEKWANCVLHRSVLDPICLFHINNNRYLKNVFNVDKYIQQTLRGYVNISAVFSPTFKMQEDEGLLPILTFPPLKPTDTYQTYLNSLPSQAHGVIFELFRTMDLDIPQMVSNFLYIADHAALQKSADINYQAYMDHQRLVKALHDSSKLNEKLKEKTEIKHTHHHSKIFTNVCLESLSSVNEQGQVHNSLEALRMLEHALGITALTAEEEQKVYNFVNKDIQEHQVNHSNTDMRSMLEGLLRRYDTAVLNSAVHRYEAVLGCSVKEERSLEDLAVSHTASSKKSKDKS